MVIVVIKNVSLLNIIMRLILTIGTGNNDLLSDNIYSFMEECKSAHTMTSKRVMSYNGYPNAI
jgi:hypothetical protein